MILKTDNAELIKAATAEHEEAMRERLAQMTDADIKRHAAFLVRLVKTARKGVIGCTDGKTGVRTEMPIERAMEIEVRALLGRA